MELRTFRTPARRSRRRDRKEPGGDSGNAADEEWCEHCLHPIDVNEAVTEAYKLVGEIERKVYFHDRCFDVQTRLTSTR